MSDLAPLSTPHTIRLLRLEPGDAGSELECSLRPYSLDNAPSFNILCYPEPEFPYIITAATANTPPRPVLSPILTSALKSLRPLPGNEAIHLWAPICFEGAAEQTHHYNLIQDIYHRASDVFIALDDGDDHDDAIPLNCIQHLLSALLYAVKEAGGKFPDPDTKPFASEDKNAPAKAGRDRFPAQDDPIWKSIFKLVSLLLPTTRDMWQYLPTALSRKQNPYFLIGPERIQKTSIFVAVQWLHAKNYDALCGDTAIEAVETFLRRYKHMQAFISRHVGVLSRLAHLNTFSITDPLEKLAITLNIPSSHLETWQSNPLPALLQVDFEKDIEHVYGNATRFFLSSASALDVPGNKAGGVFDALMQPNIANPSFLDSSQGDFPSWIPRWDLPASSSTTQRHQLWLSPLSQTWTHTTLPHQPTSRTHNPRIFTSGLLAPSPNILHIRGLLPPSQHQIAIKTVSPPLPSDLEALSKLIKAWVEDLEETSTILDSRLSVRDGLAAVLTAGIAQDFPRRSSNGDPSLGKRKRDEVSKDGNDKGKGKGKEKVVEKGTALALASSLTASEAPSRPRPLTRTSFHQTLSSIPLVPFTSSSLTAYLETPSSVPSQNFSQAIRRGGRIFYTHDHRVGWSSGAIESGDQLAVVFGGRCLYVVREMEGGAGCEYRFVGEALVPGLMEGRKWVDMRAVETWITLC